MIHEFFDFLRKYGVVGLAIAVIIGGKLNLLVSSLVNDLITPLILQPALNAAGVAKLSQLSYNGIFYGKVIASLLDFVIVAFIVFVFAKKVMKEDLVAKK
jgi:large conductance mechanosensitive channel